MQAGTKCISLTFFYVTLCVLILIESAKSIHSESYYRWRTKRQRKRKKKKKKRGEHISCKTIIETKLHIANMTPNIKIGTNIA